MPQTWPDKMRSIYLVGKDFDGLRYLRERLGERFVAGIVLYTGERALWFGDRLWAIPIATVWNH